MAWYPAIRCVGRTYANAPGSALVGCLERPPPYVFCCLAAFTDEFATFANVFHGIRWSTVVPATGLNPENRWFNTVEFSATTGAQQAVWTNCDNTGATIYAYFRTTGTGWPFRFIRYKRLFAAGFPAWPSSYDLDLDLESGWIFGTPATVTLIIPSYSQSAPNFCIP